MDNNLIINSLDLQIKSMVEDIRKKKMLLSELVLKRTDLLEETNSTPNSQERMSQDQIAKAVESPEPDTIQSKKKLEERQEDGVSTTNISMAQKHKTGIDKDYSKNNCCCSDYNPKCNFCKLKEKFAKLEATDVLEDLGVKHG